MIPAKFAGGSTDKQVFATYLNYCMFLCPETGQGQCGYKPCLLVTSAQPVDVRRVVVTMATCGAILTSVVLHKQ